MLTDELVTQMLETDDAFIKNFEDIVVHSDKISRDMINALAVKYSSTIVKFEEMIYLLSYLNPDTVNLLCLQNKEKISKDDDLVELSKYIRPETLRDLLELKNKLGE